MGLKFAPNLDTDTARRKRIAERRQRAERARALRDRWTIEQTADEASRLQAEVAEWVAQGRVTHGPTLWAKGATASDFLDV